MTKPEQKTAETEKQFHSYKSSEIPWYVRLIWILFWALAIYYIIKFFLPIIQIEMLSPP